MRIIRQLEIVKHYMNEFTLYMKRKEDIYSLERLVELLTQSLLDLGAMYLVAVGEAKPDTYRGVIRSFAERVGLDSRQRTFLEELAGFRNILVHRYAEIDREVELVAFKEILDKIPEIVKAIGDFLEKAEVGPTISDLEVKLSKVFKRHGVRYAVVFGSIARQGHGRDIDIAVSWNIDSMLKLGRLLVDIADALNVHEDTIDLVHIESAPLSLIKSIIEDGKIIYGDRDIVLKELTKYYLEYLDVNETYRYVKDVLKKPYS